MNQFWNVDVASIYPGDYGWGFVKLEALFMDSREPFLILDADTILTGPVAQELDAAFDDADAPDFIVDDENQSEADTHRLYYDWKKVREINPNAESPAFVFNSGQWAGRSGVLTHADFSPWLEWSFPRRLRYPDRFQNGDQGLFNYVLNQMAQTEKVRVRRLKIMHWPGHGMEAFNLATILKGTAPCRVIHWAGLKSIRLSAMPGSDLLQHFERLYYQRIPVGWILRPWRAATSTVHELIKRFRIWVKLFWKLKVCRTQKTPTSDAKIQ